MTLTRRQWMGAAAGTAATFGLPHALAQSGALKISHQFPSGTLTEGDFRDRLCRRFAAEVEKRTSGALKASVYPGSSLMNLVGGGIGCTLLPGRVRGVLPPSVSLVPLLPQYQMRQKISVVFLRTRERDPNLLSLLAACRSHAADLIKG